MAAPSSSQEANTPAALLALTQTDADGRYRLEQIPAGRYYIIAGLVDAPTYYPGTTLLTAATVVEVARNRIVNGLDFSLRRPTDIKVSGRVLGLIDQAPSRAVYLQGIQASSFSTTFKDDGSFEFSKVTPGSYIVHTGGPVRFGVGPIEVFNKDVTGIEIVLPAALNGRIVVEDGSNPAIFMIQANDSQSSNVLASGVRADGGFTLTMAEGEYRLSLGLTTRYAVKSIVYGSDDITTVPLRVERMVAPKDLLVTIARTIPADAVRSFKIAGHVKGGPKEVEGLPIALVAKSSAGRPAYSETLVNADGSFVFIDVKPGKYTIVAYGTMQAYTDIEVGDKDVGLELTSATVPAAPR